MTAYRAAIEYEKKGYAENYEHGQVMEKQLVSMARELEKLRAEMANAEKRARAAAAVGNQGICSSRCITFQMAGLNSTRVFWLPFHLYVFSGWKSTLLFDH